MSDISKISGGYFRPIQNDEQNKPKQELETPQEETKTPEIVSKNIDPRDVLDYMHNSAFLGKNTKEVRFLGLVSDEMYDKYGSSVEKSIKELETLIDKGVMPVLENELESLGYTASESTKSTIASLSLSLLR